MKSHKLFLTILALTIASVSKGERLPPGFQITRYNLHLKFTEDTFTNSPYQYQGFLIIQFSLDASYPTDLKLHAATDFVKIDSAYLDMNGTITDVTWIDVDEENDIVTFKGTQIANRTLNYSYLHINYTSRLSVDDMYGLYRIPYTKNGNTKYMAASQLDPVFARRMFPCLDDPTFKSWLRLNISRPPNMEVYSNTVDDYTLNMTNVDNDDDATSETKYFIMTGTMALYMGGLFLMPADDYTCTLGENFTSGTIFYFSVCSRVEMESAQVNALEVAPAIMADLYNITNYGYGLIMGFEKMELMAIPNMVESASENWGVISFREQDLLYDEENSSSLDKQNLAQLLTYELAQMWFGNMVTPEWWNYIFLTKGLAYYLQYLTTNRVYPDWDLYNQFVYRVLQPALELDSLRTSPSLRTGANTTYEIISKFDKLTLLKGASLHRMVNDVIAGYKNYRQALEYFLTSFSYRTTEPQGLWNLMSAQINLDNRARLPPSTYLKDALIDWEQNPGFPLVQVTRHNELLVIVEQKGRFLYHGLDTSFQWYVPVSYVFSSNLTDFDNTTVNEYILPNKSLTVELPSQDEAWVLFNTQATGYYRVHYGDMWANITLALQQANFSGIPELNRAQLVDDVFALAKAGIVDYWFVFDDFLGYLAAEDSVYPWTAALKGVNYILRRVGSTSELGLKIEARVFSYLSTIYKTVPWSTVNDTDQVYSIKQIEILGAACSLGYLDCVKNTVSKFTSFKNSGNRPSKNLRSIVYCTGLLYGSDTTNWDTLWKAYGTTDFAAERVKILSALGCTENEILLNKSLALTLDETSGIKSQDASLVFTSVYSHSRVGTKQALSFLMANHQAIAKRYQGMNVLRNVLVGLAEHLTENDQISQFRQFLQTTSNLAEEFKSVVEQCLEITDINTRWLDNYENNLNTIFQISPFEEESALSTRSTSTSTRVPPDASPDNEEATSAPGKSNSLV